MGLERRLIAHPNAHWNLLNKSEVRTRDLVYTPTKNVIFVYVLNIFLALYNFEKSEDKGQNHLRWSFRNPSKAIYRVKT